MTRIDANGLCTVAKAGEAPDPRQVETCRAWLRIHARPRKTINPRAYSYSLKHRAEEWAGAYISNGAFITAALAEGYRLKPEALNAYFNISFAPMRDQRRAEERAIRIASRGRATVQA